MSLISKFGAPRDLREVEVVTPQTHGGFFQEFAALARKHGLLGRVGLRLEHEHFPVADGEVLLATNDRRARTETLRPVPVRDVPAEAVPTGWRLDVEAMAKADAAAEPIIFCVP